MQNFNAVVPVPVDMRKRLVAEGHKVVPSKWADTIKNIHKAGEPDY